MRGICEEQRTINKETHGKSQHCCAKINPPLAKEGEAATTKGKKRRLWKRVGAFAAKRKGEGGKAGGRGISCRSLRTKLLRSVKGDVKTKKRTELKGIFANRLVDNMENRLVV